MRSSRGDTLRWFAYIMQDNLLHPMLTVEETLIFSAEFWLLRLEKPNPTWKKIYYYRGRTQNLPRWREPWSPPQWEDLKYAMTEGLRICYDRGRTWSPPWWECENPTRVKTNLLQRKCKAKCTWDAWVGKTQPIWREIHYDGDARPNAPETHESKNQTCMKKNPLWWRSKTKCPRDV